MLYCRLSHQAFGLATLSCLFSMCAGACTHSARSECDLFRLEKKINLLNTFATLEQKLILRTNLVTFKQIQIPRN